MIAIAPAPVSTLSRNELVQEIMWNTGGAGFGICSVGNAFAQMLDEPTSEKRDLPSIVGVSGSPAVYTDTELRWLLAFSRHVTAAYDLLGYRYRRGANFVLIGKTEGGSWLRKRQSWTMGPMYSSTMLGAMRFMLKKG